MWSAIYDGFVAGIDLVFGEDCHRQPIGLRKVKDEAKTIKNLNG